MSPLPGTGYRWRMTFAQTERAELCDLLLQVGPSAPTLCEGWDTHDLAAHLWIRETDPIGSLGFFAPRFADLTQRRVDRLKSELTFAELVGKLRGGPPRLSPFGLPGVDSLANGGEFFVHHEDVRRAGEAPLPPRVLDAEVEDRIWSQLRFMAGNFFRGAKVGIVLERNDTPEPESFRVVAGTPIVTIQGRPSELLLYAFGRRPQADVHLVGEPGAIGQLAPGAAQ